MLLAVVFCLTAARVGAAVEVNVEKAGTLSTLIVGTETDLKLTGSINGTDVKCLRQLINDGKLTSLDRSEVHIVSGGEAYYESYKTANDVIGESMFTEKTNGSKLALAGLSQILAGLDFVMIDCQFPTDHLRSMGGVEISWEEYRELLDRGLKQPS